MRDEGEAEVGDEDLERWGEMGRDGEIWGDMGRYGEMWGDVGRDGERWLETRTWPCSPLG